MRLYHIHDNDKNKTRMQQDSIGVGASIVGYEPDINDRNKNLIMPPYVRK